MPEKEKQLTPEQEKLQEKVRKEAEKEGLPQKDIEKLADLAGVVGGMSKTAKRILIDSTIALGGAALGAAAFYGGQRFNQWHKGRNEKPADTNINASKLVSSTPSQPQAVAAGSDSPSPSAQPSFSEGIKQLQEISKKIPLD